MSKFMRMLVFFDLPVKTKAQQRVATGFRNFLLKDGYHMVQYSLYARVCNGNDAVEKHEKRLRGALPDNGSVRLLVVTEKQYESIRILVGKLTDEETRPAGEQLSIFEKEKRTRFTSKKITKKRFTPPRIACNSRGLP